MNGKPLNYYRNKHVLVTGGTGYIGSSLVKELKKASCNIIALDSRQDIRDNNFWKRYLKKVDIIFHLGAQTSSKWANENPLADAEINLLPVIRLIESCQKFNVFPDIIFSGTVTQVGLTKTYPVDESFQDNPITIYDINKLAAEKFLQFYSNQLKKRAVTLRLANVYGPGLTSRSKDRGILNLFIRRALKGEALTLWGKGDFVRDYIYIDDVVEAFLIAGKKIKNIKGSYFVVGAGTGHTIKEMVLLIRDQIENIISKKIKIKSVPLPKNLSPIEWRNFVANSKKFRQATDWRAKVSLKKGVRQTIKYFIKKKNEI